MEVGLFLSQMMSTVRSNRVCIDPSFATLCVGTIVLEGIGRQLDSDINILDQAVPYLLWSDKATLDDRMIFLREKYRDEVLDQPREVPAWTRLYKIVEPIVEYYKSLGLDLAERNV